MIKSLMKLSRAAAFSLLGLGLVLLGCVILAPAAAWAGDPAGYHYYYFKQKRSLTVDSGKMAVRRHSGQPAAGALLKGVSAERPLPVRGWSLLTVETAVKSRARMENRVREAAVDRRFSFVSPVFRSGADGHVIVTPTLLIGFQEGVSGEHALEIINQTGAGTVTAENWAGMPGVFRVQSTARNGFDVLAAANRLAQLPEVHFAEPDMLFTGRRGFIPDDPDFGKSWGLHNTGQPYGTENMDMDGPEAWDISTGDPGILVVIIDDGVQQDHPDLHQVPGTDTTGVAGDGGPVNGGDIHGTMVAGCVSAIIDNGLGSAGIAPHTRVASAKAHVSTGGDFLEVQDSWVVDALSWAESIGARVTNNSNSYDFDSSVIAAKYAQTRDNGMVHFAAAGNGGSTTIVYPANLPSVNAVAAVNRYGDLASFSDHGDGIAFAAPGVSIFTTDRTGIDGYNGTTGSAGDYATISGTSFASPYAAGVAALVLSINRALSAAEVEQILQQSAKDLGTAGYDTTFGWGLVNAHDAAVLAQNALCPGDLDHDGDSDGADLALFAGGNPAAGLQEFADYFGKAICP